MVEVVPMEIDIDDKSINCAKYIFVDVIGFRNKKRFICKEFCLIDGDFEYHAIIKPPYSFKKLLSCYQRKAQWEIDHYHQLKYDMGSINSIELVTNTYERLTKKKIIVENAQKIRFLKYIFRNCSELDCLSIEDTGFDMTLQSDEPYRICDYHNNVFGWKKCHCATATALKLKEITENNLNLISTLSNENEVDRE